MYKNKSQSILLLIILLGVVAECSLLTSAGIYVGSFAFCSNTCVNANNQGCTGKCITFRDNVGGKNIRSHTFLAEMCWKINTCAEFPKFYSFQTDNQCNGKCQVNAFPGFSKKQLNQNQDLYNTKGYNMMCIEQASEDSPLPNLCTLAQPYAVKGEISNQKFISLFGIGLILLMLALNM